MEWCDWYGLANDVSIASCDPLTPQLAQTNHRVREGWVWALGSKGTEGEICA